MPLSKSIHLYHDIATILASARKAGGGIFNTESPRAAVRWRMRAYYYRKLLAEQDEAKRLHMPGYSGSTEWDDMTLSLDGHSVRIEFGKVHGSLTGLDGQKLALTKPGVPAPSRPTDTIADAELLAAAAELALDLDK